MHVEEVFIILYCTCCEWKGLFSGVFRFVPLYTADICREHAVYDGISCRVERCQALDERRQRYVRLRPVYVTEDLEQVEDHVRAPAEDEDCWGLSLRMLAEIRTERAKLTEDYDESHFNGLDFRLRYQSSGADPSAVAVFRLGFWHFT